MSEAKIKVVEDLPGVGPAIAEKLRDAGYDTLEAIGTHTWHPFGCHRNWKRIMFQVYS